MPSPRFSTTRWSIVLAAGRTAPADRDGALARLCEMYWYPLYAFVRGQGFDRDESQDLTQEFFARVLEKHYLDAATPERGRFRSFLIASIKHFLSNERDRARTLKRGGGQIPLSLEFEAGETHYSLEPADPDTPETQFERRWALAVIEQVLAALHRECVDAGHEDRFERLKLFLMDEEDRSYRDVAKELGLSEGAVKVAVHRLRRRFGELLRAEVAHTVADPADIDDELRYLVTALR